MELLDDDWVAVRDDIPSITVKTKSEDVTDGPQSFGEDQIEVLVDEDNKCIQLFYFCEKNHEVQKHETRFQVDGLATLHFQLTNMVENFDVKPPTLAISTEYSGKLFLQYHSNEFICFVEL